MISIIVAVGKDNVIGKGNRIPWRLPQDMAYFKRITTGHIVIMGRKTFESMGKPLIERENWIITRDRNYWVDGAKIFYSVNEVIENIPEEEVFIIGGEKIYREFLPKADKLYVTHIVEYFDGDTFFPDILSSMWKMVSKAKGEKNDKNPYVYYFTVYDRIG